MSTATMPKSKLLEKQFPNAKKLEPVPLVPTDYLPEEEAGHTVQEKFHIARSEMVTSLVERDSEVDLLFIAMLAGEHVLFVGPPGVAKSLTLDAIMRLIDGVGFDLLMTKFTALEELFGPFSLRELENDRFVRCTARKLPEAHTAYLDEIFKCSPAILNALLRIMNEGTFDAGHGPVKVPLRLMVASSNEYPRDDDGLHAMLDRFLIRKNVKPVSTSVGRHKLLWGGDHTPKLSVQISLQELEDAREEVKQIPWSDEARKTLDTILDKLKAEGIRPSDRRQYKALRVAQAAAYYDGAAEVEPEHLEVLANVLWDDPQDQPQKCATVVCQTCNPVIFEVNGYMIEAEQIISSIKDPSNTVEAASASKKLKSTMNKLKALKDHPKVKEARDHVSTLMKELRAKAMGAEDDDS